MAQFNFNKDVADAIRMDGPLQSNPQMRWQRKTSEANINKTPGKSGSSTAVTPGKPKTPKTPGLRADLSKSGKKSGKKTPGRAQDDRFIPNRATTDMEYGHYALMKGSNNEDNQENTEYQERLKDALDVRDRKILNFRTKAPEPKRYLFPTEPDMNNLNVLYNGAKSSGVGERHSSRQIPREPERVLDAPDLMDDYYLNLLDWSKSNMFAVALGDTMFLWNAANGSITHLCELQGTDYFTSVSWVEEGEVLAVGVSSGVVQLWDTNQQKLIRSMTGHAARVGSLSWNKHMLSSGSRTGAIHQHDVRVAQHQVASLVNHSQEVCGLKWSPDGNSLASGGNDNTVNIWSNRQGGPGGTTPLYTFTEHQAAVKALAWCPWQPHILASGGGTSDRQIKLWNIQSGSNISSTDTGSQVCSILWSKEHKELISGHGFSLNHLRIWKYPTMTRVVDLVGHTSRVLCMSMSPDGQTVASAAADETIRLWKCFEKKPSTGKGKKTKEEKVLSTGLGNICLR